MLSLMDGPAAEAALRLGAPRAPPKGRSGLACRKDRRRRVSLREQMGQENIRCNFQDGGKRCV